jgi:hypothetical protein
MYAGLSTVSLFRVVRAVTCVTQNSDRAVAWAFAAALILNGCLKVYFMSSSIWSCFHAGAITSDRTLKAVVQEVLELVSSIIDDESDDFASDCVDDHGLADGVREALVEVLVRLREVVALISSPPHEVIPKLGYNCHLPNSYQTPLHCALYALSALVWGSFSMLYKDVT